mmetsp:Transcript_33355/g.87489  ORF Transcript_33355/g.87489 Transcript_33355/m.87489 type:complete len:371 (+) Transcript_33355:156-1268(+)
MAAHADEVGPGPGYCGAVPEWEPRHIPKVPTYSSIEAYASIANSVCEPPASTFEVRGANYLNDKKKITALEPIFSMVDVRPFSHHNPVWNAAATLKPLRDYLAAHPDREFFIANRVLPLESSVHVMAIFVRTRDKTVDPVFERSWQRFKDGDDAYRNARLKYMAKIPNASFMVRSTVGAMGGFRPVIMGKGYLEMKHFSGANYTEVDIDIGSSRIARGVVGVVIPQAKKMMVDEAFFVEGQQADELPERLLGACRCVRYDLSANTLPISDAMLVSEGAAAAAAAAAAPPGGADGGVGAGGAGGAGVVTRDDVVNELGAAFDVEPGVAVLAADSFATYDVAVDADAGAVAAAAHDASDSDDEFFDAASPPC